MASTMGTTRNRSDIYLNFRRRARDVDRSFSKTDDPELGIADRLMNTAIDSAAPASIEMTATTGGGASSSFAPPYFLIKEEVDTHIAEIRRRVSQLQGLYERATLVTFDDDVEGDDEINVLSHEISRLFRKCEVLVMKLEAKGLSKTDDKVCDNLQRALALEIQTLSTSFRRQQRQYLKKLSQRDKPTSQSSSALDDIKMTSDTKGSDVGFTPLQELQLNYMETEAAERDKEVQDIITSITDLTNIMKDMNTLVIDQGSLMDRIDYNIEQVSQSAEEGMKALAIAEKRQKTSRVIFCIFTLVAAVIIMLLIVTMKEVIVVTG